MSLWSRRNVFLGATAAGLFGRASSPAFSQNSGYITDNILEYMKEASGALRIKPTVTVLESNDESVVSIRPTCKGSYLLMYSEETLLSLLQTFDSNALRFVVYHEMSHILQFEASSAYLDGVCQRLGMVAKGYELLADCGAGYVFASLWKEVNYGGASQVIAELSDYEFSDVVHHGFVAERVSAFGLGGAIEKAGLAFDMKKLIRNISAFEKSLFHSPGGLRRSQADNDRESQELLRELYR